MSDCKKCESYNDCKEHMTNPSWTMPDCPDFKPAATAPCEKGTGPCDPGRAAVCPRAVQPTGLLTKMFRLQAELNARYGFELKHAENNDLYAGAWIHDYITAMTSELEELRSCLHWKHWHAEARAGRRFNLHDREHAKVEIVDLLFFWMSMAQAAGLTPETVFDLYKAKLGINHERRDQNMTSEQAHGHELET